MRIALGIQYNGSQYHGWQIQPELSTVQAVVETALSKVAASDGIIVTCAGRTDTGVHAISQVVHFDTAVEREMRAWVFGSNSYLPSSVAVQWAKVMPDDFHARFSAESRHYRYFIYNHSARPAVLPSQVTWYYQHLDEKRMHRSAKHLLGKHDFSAYRAVGCQAKSPVRSLDEMKIWRQGDMVIIDVRANGFLHHMVRNIVGVLLAVGSGKAGVDWSKEVLESRDRRLGGITAPAHGLYFVNASYPKKFSVPVAHVPLLQL